MGGERKLQEATEGLPEKVTFGKDPKELREKATPVSEEEHSGQIKDAACAKALWAESCLRPSKAARAAGVEEVEEMKTGGRGHKPRGQQASRYPERRLGGQGCKPAGSGEWGENRKVEVNTETGAT